MKKTKDLVLPIDYKWDDIDPQFAKGSRYAITIPETDVSDLQFIEVTVVKKPGKNERTVLVEMDGEVFRYPKKLLRLVIDDDTRAAIEDAEMRKRKLQPDSAKPNFADRLKNLRQGRISDKDVVKNKLTFISAILKKA